MARQRRLAKLDDFQDPVLIVTAHPDDIEVHCGGTLAQLVTAGKHVTCVLCTSGNRGTSDVDRRASLEVARAADTGREVPRAERPVRKCRQQ
jgi:LmbE family N-acetylglucosaminyl deacetylase